MPAAPVDVLAPFPGLSPDALTFLRQLKRNNDREWFRPRKETYDEELLEPMRMLVSDLSRRLPEAGVPLSGDPKRAVFRIYRDTRFSKNKAPYKTHLAAVVSRDGDKRAPGALYVHIEPGAHRIAGGFWRADKDFLRGWRTRLAQDPQTFLDLVADAQAAGLTMGTSGSTLTRMPRGFDDQRDNAAADYFAWKGGFAASREDLTDEDVESPAFADQIVETARALGPLLEYGWSIVDETS